jgi:hypothetical protein
MPPTPGTAEADQFDRRQMLAAAIGFLILVVGGYAATWGDLTPLQATTLRITVSLSVAGLVASAVSMIPTIHIESALVKTVLFAGIVATGMVSYASFPTASPIPDLSGDWICMRYCPAGGEGKRARITQNERQLQLVNEGGGVSAGQIADDLRSISANNWGVSAAVEDNGQSLRWSNGTVWLRSQATQIAVSGVHTEYSLDGVNWSPAVPAWVHPAWPKILGASWVWKSTFVTEDDAINGSTVVQFRQRFELRPSDPTSGILEITADNAYSVSLNGTFLGSSKGPLDASSRDDQTFRIIDTYKFVALPGPNELTIKAINYHWPYGGSPTPRDNPAGVVFRVALD